MNSNVIEKLKNAGLLSDSVEDLGSVSTGSYTLNRVISGDYKKGIPIGGITQFHGEASTAKTVFVTHILKEAQALGHYTMLVDSENAYNATFAEHLGVDPSQLIYTAPETVEDCFNVIENTIKEIRELDKDTPIVIGYDSIAVSPSKAEYEAENYDGNNMQGAVRAKAIGNCLKKINPILRKYKVALVIINQIRNKVGVMFGSPDTMAAGGKSLEYYLAVNMKTISNKTSDLIKDERGDACGIEGRIRNTKNKVSLPFRETEFKLLFNEGLIPHFGLLEELVKDGIVERHGAWYNFGEQKFQKKTFNDGFEGETFKALRDHIGLS
jgi:recombination protein RecA